MLFYNSFGLKMKKWLLLISIIYGIIVPACAQEVVSLKLKKGAVYKWDYKLSKSGSPFASSTPVSLSVVKVMKSGYLVDYRSGETTFGDPEAAKAAKELLEKMAEINRGLVIRIVLDDSGSIVDIVNFEDIKRAADKVLNLTTSLNKNSNVSPESLQKMFSTKEAVANIFLKDLPVVFYGVGYPRGVSPAQDYETELPNPFGGLPLAAKGVTQVTSTDLQSKTITIDTQQEVSPEAVVNMLSDSAKRLGKPIVNEDELMESAKNWRIRDEIHVEVDTRSGLATKARLQREAMIDGRTQLNLAEFVAK